ncbi:membrane fusion protein, multidrug efflux system, partial [Nitrosospira sp. Nsp14]
MYTYSLSVYRSTLLGLTLCVTVAACGQNEAASRQPGATSLPVSMIEVQSASVPISAEAVAQTEGAKEVEIRPRVGGILLKR